MDKIFEINFKGKKTIQAKNIEEAMKKMNLIGKKNTTIDEVEVNEFEVPFL